MADSRNSEHPLNRLGLLWKTFELICDYQQVYFVQASVKTRCIRRRRYIARHLDSAGRKLRKETTPGIPPSQGYPEWSGHLLSFQRQGEWKGQSRAGMRVENHVLESTTS